MQNIKKVLTPISLTLFFYLAIGLSFLYFHSWDVSSFVVFGKSNPITQAFIQDGIFIHQDAGGYDGQFFYLMARKPFDITLVQESMISPVWRYQRILYPFVTFVLSGLGNPGLVKFMLPLVNLLSVLGLTIVLVKMLEVFNISKWYSLFFSLSPGLVYSFLYNLAEPLTYFLVALASYLFIKNNHKLSLLFFVLAILTREVALFAVLGVVVYLLWNKKYKKSIFYSLTFLVYLFWVLLLGVVFEKNNSVNYVNFNITFPFSGLWLKLQLLFSQNFWHIFLDGTFYIYILLISIVSFLSLFKKQTFFNISATLYIAFASTFSIPLLLFPKEYTRHFLGLSLFALLAILVNKNKFSFSLAAFNVVISALALIDLFILQNLFR